MGIACLLLALLLVGGPGPGLKSSGSTAGSGGSGPDSRGAGSNAVEAAAGSSVPEMATAAGKATADAVRPAPRLGDALVGPAAGHSAPGPLDLQTRDLVFGTIAAAQEATQLGEFSVACRLLDSIGGASSHADLVPAIDAAQTALHAALAGVAALVAADIEAGHALRAAARVEALLTEPHPIVRRAVEADWARRGWVPPLAGGDDPPAATEVPLTDRRTVWVAVDSQWWAATVIGAAASPGQVTLRVETAAGIVFPTVDRAALEPVEPTPVEVAAQVRACIRIGRTAAAWAWWMVARTRGHRLDPELVRTLEAMRR